MQQGQKPNPTQQGASQSQSGVGTYFLGRYRVVDEIGIGGMASVHLARMDGPGGFQKWIAIKRIHAHLVEDETFIQMFLDEARVAARISHPNVATVFELGKHEDTYWIAMEYLHGEPLRELMRRTEELGTTMPPEIACRVIADAAEGLHAAHELLGKNGEKLNLVHRDVTPHNLFVTYDGNTKVVDFGIAKFTSRMASTRAGTLKGKLAYMSPEQVAGEQIDRRTDVFALGVVLWELTTGQRLFRMESDLDTLAKVQECNVTRPSTLVRGYPLDLEKIVMKALSKNRGERFKTAREFSRALQSLLMKRGLFIASDEVASYTKSIFQDRIQKREAHLRWAAEVTQTISLDQLEKAGAGATQEPSMQSYKSEVQPAQKAPPPARGAPLPAPRPAAGMPAIPGIGLSQTGETRAARGSIPSAARPSTPHDEQDETDDGPTIMSAAPEVEDDFDDSDATMVKIPDAPRAAGAPPPAAGRRAAPEPPVSQPQTAIAVPPRALPSRNIDHAPLPAVVVEHSSAPPQARVPTVPPNKGLNTTLAMPSRPSAQPALPFPFPQHQQHHQHQHYDQPIAQPPLPMPFQAQAPLPPLDQRTVEIRAIKSGVPIWAVALLSGAAALILLSVVYIVAVPGKKPAPVVAPVGSSRAPFTAARVKFDEALAPTSLINDAPPAFPSALASAPPVVSALPVASARPSVAAVTHNTPTTQPVVNNPPTNTGTKPLPMALPASPYGNPSTGGGGKIATGQLTVICKPSCDTILDGTTSLPIPVYKKALPVGQHRLRLVSNGIMKTITVMILADQVDVETVSMTP